MRPSRTARQSPISSPEADAATAAGGVAGKGQRRVQMADIARMAGVSASTVSRALSGSPLIPEETRQRIEELARSLNYRVNEAAASLRKRSNRTVGVVVLGESMQAISDPFVLSIFGAIADALDARGMSLLLTRLREDQQDLLAESVKSGRVAGQILIGQASWHQHLNQLAAQGVPMAVWGACLPDALYSVVGGDNEQGGYLAARHLIKKGCKRIAFFGDITHPEVGLRYGGYCRALAEAGLKPQPELHQSFLFGDARIRESVDQWLDRDVQFDGVFAASDVTAILIMGALRERRVRVPQDVKVVGYDDIVLAEHVHPKLTSVKQPVKEAGDILVEQLLRSIDGQPREIVTLPARLIERGSSR